MTTKSMVPPDNGSRNTVLVKGRQYSSAPNVPISVSSFDVGTLQANGWYTQSIVPGSSAATGETIYGKIRRLSAKYFSNCPIANLKKGITLVGATAWSSGLVVTAGTIISNAGNAYIATNSATTGTAAPTGFGMGISDGAVTWNYYGPQTAPVITALGTTAPAGYTNIFQFNTHPERFVLYGGTPTTLAFGGGTYLDPWARTTSASGSGSEGSNPALNPGTHNGAIVHTDAIAPVFTIFPGQSGIRFIIDETLYVLGGGFGAAPGSAPSYIKLDFTNAGGNSPRTIELEQSSRMLFQDVRVQATDTLAAIGSSDTLTMALFGDSITGATGTSGLQANGWGSVMMQRLGIRRKIISGEGGTGYLNSISGTKLNLLQRITDITGLNPVPDLIGIAMGINDQSVFTNTAIVNQMTSVIQTIRAAPGFATVPLFIFGVFTGAQAGLLAISVALEAAIQTQVQAMMITDSNLFFVPVSGNGSATDQPWLTGTGSIAAPAGNGNADRYISGSGSSTTPHPNDNGHFYYGTRGALGILTAIAGKP